MQIVHNTQQEEKVQNLINQLRGLNYDNNGNAIDRVAEAALIGELEAMGVEL